jgi:NDP-sugar pyrophosphorylase family protein
VEAYFGQGQRWGLSIDYVLQRDNWGTAGSLEWAKPLLTDAFAVLPADTIVDLNLEAVFRNHRARQMPATIVVRQSSQQNADNLLQLNEDGQVIGLNSKTNGEAKWHNTGVYIFEPQVLDLIPARTKAEIHDQLIPAILDAGWPVNTYQMEGYWNELNTFSQYQEAQSVLLQSAMNPSQLSNRKSLIRHSSLDGRRVAQGIWIGRNTVVHPSTRLALPVYIGENCLIGRDAEIGPNVIIGKNVIVDDEATISNSTILDNTYVGQLVRAEQRVVNKGIVVDVETAEHAEIIDEHLLGSTHQNVAFNGLSRFIQAITALILLLITLPLTLPLALLSLLTTGHMFRAIPRAQSQSWPSDQTQPGPVTTFKLIRFSTRRSPGHPSSIGRWLERLEWHRLPELLNVVKGDMALIGVKPLAPDTAVQLTDDWQLRRNECRVGFSGLWYIQTQHGSDLDETLVADAYYAATRDWRVDGRLLWQTPGAWLRRVKNNNR